MSIFDLAPGLHPDVPPAVYHERHANVVSKSALDRLRRSPAHLKAWVDGAADDDDSPAFTFGRAFHCAVLEPDRYELDYAVAPDFGDCRKTENKRAREMWREANAGAELVSDHDAVRIRGMVASVRRHPLAGKMVTDGRSELTLVWKDEITGLTCKTRSDYYVEKLAMVADIKSTEDACQEAFRKDIVKFRYHWQDALYRAGYGAIGAAVRYFVFIAVEKSPPYAVAVHTLESDGIGRGYTHVRRLIDQLAECVANDSWPAYPVTIQTIDLPPWA